MSDIESRVEQLEKTLAAQVELTAAQSENIGAIMGLVLEVVKTTNQLQQQSIDDLYERARILRGIGASVPELPGEKEYLERRSG